MSDSSYELRVASCELRVASCELRAASCECGYSNKLINLIKMKIRFLILIVGLIMVSACSSKKVNPDEEDWVQLFNGKDLSGWDFKITKHALNENYNNTVRVEDGVMKVCYDGYDSFDGEFTHIFYQEKFSYYKLRVEYRFTGEQVTGGPGWTIRNSGVMIHSQSAASMGLDQSFPTSIEVQYLGGLSDGNSRSTANLCTPGTNVEMYGDLFRQHCTNSDASTYDGDQWVMVEAVVYGDSTIAHVVEGDTVISYQKPQLDDNDPLYAEMLKHYGSRVISSGYLALQGESHPVEFRKVELLNLEGCTDPKALNYKSYFIKSDNSRCIYKK